MNLESIKNKILPFALPFIFFCLPWQTRYIFANFKISGHEFEYGVISLYAVEVLVALAFILYWRLKIRVEYQKIVGFGFLFLIITLGSAFFAINQSVGLGQFIHVFFAITLLLLLLDERTCLKRVAFGFVAGLFIPIGFGIWQVFAGWSDASTILGLAIRDAQTLGDAVLTLSDGTRILRAYGSFGHPNIFGGYLVVGLLSALMFRQHKKIAHSERSDESRVHIINLFWNYAMYLVLIIALIFTFSQSAWLALFVAFVCGYMILYFYCHFERRERFVRFLPWMAGAFSVIILLGSILGILALSSYENNQVSIIERAEQYREWPSVVSNAWVFGSGLGNYTFAIEQYDSLREWWQYQPVHNVLMLIIGEVGIVGLVILISWFYEIDKLNFSRLPSKRAVVALAMGCALLVIAGLDHYLWTQWSGLALCAYAMAMTVRMK